MTNKLNTAEVIVIASDRLVTLSGHIFDRLTFAKPITPDAMPLALIRSSPRGALRCRTFVTPCGQLKGARQSRTY